MQERKGQIVIPVFYNIDPSDVRKQTGSYKQAFAKYEGEPRCNKWKSVLTEAANLAGWDSRTYRTDPELLKDIVGDVLRKLPPRYTNKRKGLVGIEKNYEQIESLLKIGSNEVRTIGIWGLGGIGKTTLATALYDQLSHKFKGGCFLANVRESDKLKDLHDNSYISSLCGKKVFIVLDDVATSEQLEKLIVDYDFGQGSRVIVTTRNKQILSLVDEIYQVEELSFHKSLELFCLTVFGEKQPNDGYEDLSRRVISYCKGIPLALKVLGASLRSRSKEVWECELRKLQKIPNMEIHKVLKLSYDGLDRSQQDIFLDIACFFKGHDRDWVTKVLEAFDFFPASGIEVLLDKALITISYGNRIDMHDLIQKMGREIVHQESKDPRKRTRLWGPEEVHDVLKYNKGTDVVEGILLDPSKLTEDLYLSSYSLAKMTNMRFLNIYGVYRKYTFKMYFPNGLESMSGKLRYLHWDEYYLESLPPKFCAEQLVVLCMKYSKLKKLWDGIQNLVNLKEIDLSYSRDLIEIPNLSKAEKLESVSLSGCESLCQLHVHSKSLHELRLQGCSSLKEFSVASKEMILLDLSKTAIYALSLSMLSLPKIKYLDLTDCSDLNSCSFLREFSVTSKEMTELNLSSANICVLSSSVGHFLTLEGLELSGTNVDSLPENIKNLSMMTSLRFDDCLPELLPSLEELHLNDCLKLVSLPELPSSLRVLDLNDCRKLVSLPELPPSLPTLRAFNCISLDAEITQRLVLQHLLQSGIPYTHQEHLNNLDDYCDYEDCPVNKEYFIFPGDHVTDKCGFRATENSITIPYLPKSDLCGFIYCIVLSTESVLHNRVNYIDPP